MKILFTAPFWSPKINSISKGPIYLGSIGHDILVITAQKANSLKGKVYAPTSEIIEKTEFFRPYLHSNEFTWHPKTHWTEVVKKVAEFQPDVIVGFGDPFFRIPVRLSRHFDIPLVMFFEYLQLNKFSIPIRGGGKIQKYFPKFYRLCSGCFRRYLANQCSAIMFSYYGDHHLIPAIKQYCPIVRYVPWCTETDDINADNGQRNRKTGIYIGSLEKFKNAAELVEAIPIILDHTKTEQFIVVGPGEYAPQIQRLADRYGPRLIYHESLPRQDAVKLLHSAGYGYTPVRDCGLGFIGDCWGTGTPLIATNELDGFLRNGVDTLVANGIEELPKIINFLLNSEDLFENVRRNGHNRYTTDLTAQSVGERYISILKPLAVEH